MGGEHDPGKKGGTGASTKATATGSHRLEAAAPGHVPLVTDFVMRDDRDVTARIELRRRPSRWHLEQAAAVPADRGAVVGRFARLSVGPCPSGGPA